MHWGGEQQLALTWKKCPNTFVCVLDCISPQVSSSRLRAEAARARLHHSQPDIYPCAQHNTAVLVSTGNFKVSPGSPEQLSSYD